MPRTWLQFQRMQTRCKQLSASCCLRLQVLARQSLPCVQTALSKLGDVLPFPGEVRRRLASPTAAALVLHLL